MAIPAKSTAAMPSEKPAIRMLPTARPAAAVDEQQQDRVRGKRVGDRRDHGSFPPLTLVRSRRNGVRDATASDRGKTRTVSRCRPGRMRECGPRVVPNRDGSSGTCRSDPRNAGAGAFRDGDAAGGGCAGQARLVRCGSFERRGEPAPGDLRAERPGRARGQRLVGARPSVAQLPAVAAARRGRRLGRGRRPDGGGDHRRDHGDEHRSELLQRVPLGEGGRGAAFRDQASCRGRSRRRSGRDRRHTARPG